MLVELPRTMDIVISGIQEKKNADGERNGWSSTAFETYDSCRTRNKIDIITMAKEGAKKYLKAYFLIVYSNDETVKKLEKLF